MITVPAPPEDAVTMLDAVFSTEVPLFISSIIASLVASASAPAVTINVSVSIFTVKVVKLSGLVLITIFPCPAYVATFVLFVQFAAPVSR